MESELSARREGNLRVASGREDLVAAVRAVELRALSGQQPHVEQREQHHGAQAHLHERHVLSGAPRAEREELLLRPHGSARCGQKSLQAELFRRLEHRRVIVRERRIHRHAVACANAEALVARLHLR